MRICCGGLSQGDTSGVIDDAARLVSERGLYYLDRTKAVLTSYLAGLIKGVIPPYYSYYREDPSLVTVQEVVGFLYKAVKDNDWMKIQGTMDVLERLALDREVPQYLLWISLATPQELNATKAELVKYFELDNGRSVGTDVARLLGVDLERVKKYLIYGVGIYAGLLLLPAIVPALSGVTRSLGRSVQPQTNRGR